MWITREIPSHIVKTYSYVDDFNCTARFKKGLARRRRVIEAITAARKARQVVSQELESNGWTRDPDNDEEINFGLQGEAKWVGVTFTPDLSWKRHCKRRLDLAEAASACISRLETSRAVLARRHGGKYIPACSIRAIATYGWELGYTAEDRLRKVQYKAMRKITGAHHGARLTTL